MLIDAALLMLAFLLSIPVVTGYFAYSYNRSFWGWFIAACLFPVLTQIILALLCHKDAQREQHRRSAFLSRYEDEQMHQRINEILLRSSEKKDHL